MPWPKLWEAQGAALIQLALASDHDGIVNEVRFLTIRLKAASSVEVSGVAITGSMPISEVV